MIVLLLCAPSASAGPDTAKPAPSFTLPTRDGTVVSDSLRGRVVYVDFWASWCGPCRKSFPWLASLQERYAAKGLTVVAINLDKDRKLADKFLAQYSTPFVVAFDPTGKTAEAFQVRGMPSSYLVSPSGAILSSHAGFDPKDAQAIETSIREACAK
jgi:thiol-disulfide isomerase/thioredoxin